MVDLGEIQLEVLALSDKINEGVLLGLTVGKVHIVPLNILAFMVDVILDAKVLSSSHIIVGVGPE